MPGIRPAWPRVAGLSEASLLAALGRKPTHGAVVEIGRQQQGLVPPEGQDIGLLPVQIAGIMPVGLQLQGHVGPNSASSGQMPGELGEPDAAMGEKLHGRTPLAVLGYRKPGRFQRRGRGRERGQPRARLRQGRGLGGKGGAAARPDRAPGLAQRGQAQVGIVGPQAKPIFGPRGEHAIGLVGAPGHQVVDHHPDIGFAVQVRGPRRARAAFSPAIRPWAAASS